MKRLEAVLASYMRRKATMKTFDFYARLQTAFGGHLLLSHHTLGVAFAGYMSQGSKRLAA
jgi:hypothetical protein